jgi:hypothetical protein
MPTATFLRSIKGWKGDARLYELSEPGVTDDGEQYDHVIVSAIVADYTGPETYIFPAKADGEALDYIELPGSYRGGLDHESALTGAGYEVAF